MNKEDYLDAISKQRNIQKSLNNIYIWSKMSVLSLEEIEGNRELLNEMSTFPVPSRVPNKVVNRKTETIIEALDMARTTELYKALVVYIVSLVEPVLLEIVRLTLLYDKRRLKIKPKGSESKLEYDTIIDCGNYDEIIEVIIAKYADALGYSRPSDQLEYIEKLLSIDIDDDLWKKWVEIKASRDLIVHNNCIINKVYIEKAGDKARGEIGKDILINEEYYNDVIIVSKSLIGQIVSRITKKEKSK